jgi:hypothetical protein
MAGDYIAVPWQNVLPAQQDVEFLGLKYHN